MGSRQLGLLKKRLSPSSSWNASQACLRLWKLNMNISSMAPVQKSKISISNWRYRKRNWSSLAFGLASRSQGGRPQQETRRCRQLDNQAGLALKRAEHHSFISKEPQWTSQWDKTSTTKRTSPHHHWARPKACISWARSILAFSLCTATNLYRSGTTSWTRSRSIWLMTNQLREQGSLRTCQSLKTTEATPTCPTASRNSSIGSKQPSRRTSWSVT